MAMCIQRASDPECGKSMLKFAGRSAGRSCRALLQRAINSAEMIRRDESAPYLKASSRRTPGSRKWFFPRFIKGALGGGIA